MEQAPILVARPTSTWYAKYELRRCCMSSPTSALCSLSSHSTAMSWHKPSSTCGAGRVAMVPKASCACATGGVAVVRSAKLVSAGREQTWTGTTPDANNPGREQPWEVFRQIKLHLAAAATPSRCRHTQTLPPHPVAAATPRRCRHTQSLGPIPQSIQALRCMCGISTQQRPSGPPRAPLDIACRRHSTAQRCGGGLVRRGCEF
eukprot:157583-Chlamydomonas_euryale.AAC.2